MERSVRFTISLAWFLLFIGAAHSQKASSVPADLKFTKEIATRFHIVAWVTVQLHDGSTEKFQYDRYPQEHIAERIKNNDGVFARPFGKAWMRSDDWGETGQPVAAEKAQDLDTDVNIVAAPLLPPTNHDTTQGGVVWRFVDATSKGSVTDYTFMESREHPKTAVDYPQYTFMKAPGDKDGRLFLCGVTANLRDDAVLIPITMRMTYLVPLPAGTKVTVYDKNTGGKGQYDSWSEFRLGGNYAEERTSGRSLKAPKNSDLLNWQSQTPLAESW